MTTASKKPYRYLHCTCPDTAKRGERCSRDWARCQTRANAFLEEACLNATRVEATIIEDEEP